jgi:hypothetical protein
MAAPSPPSLPPPWSPWPPWPPPLAPDAALDLGAIVGAMLGGVLLVGAFSIALGCYVERQAPPVLFAWSASEEMVRL